MPAKMTVMDKEVERRFLEAARQVSSVFPDGDFISHERPDFLISSAHGMLGIEVTELCKRSEIERTERLTYVAPKAKEIYSRRPGASPISVNPVFLLNTHVGVTDLAQGLADFVYRHRDDLGTFSWHRCDDMPAGYHTIAIFEPLPHHPEGKWHHSKAFRGFVADKALLNTCLAEKNRRVPSYRAAASHVWLLIINDQWRGAGEVYARPQDVERWTFDFTFDKVLLFSRPLGEVGSVTEVRRN